MTTDVTVAQVTVAVKAGGATLFVAVRVTGAGVAVSTLVVLMVVVVVMVVDLVTVGVYLFHALQKDDAGLVRTGIKRMEEKHFSADFC